MQERKSGATLFDWLLVAAVVSLTCVIGLVVASSPTTWRWCLDRLDLAAGRIGLGRAWSRR